MFMLGMLKTILKTMLKYEKNTITLYGHVENHIENHVEVRKNTITLYGHVENHIENHVEVRKKHHPTLWCVLKLSGRGLKIRRQTTRFESEFTRVTKVRHI